MPRSEEKFLDYEPVTPGRRASEDPDSPKTERFFAGPSLNRKVLASNAQAQAGPRAVSALPDKNANWLVRRGHTLSFIGVFLFTIAVYLRPYELIESLRPLSTMAFWLAVLTILVFVPTQLGLEGKLTSGPREVKLLLLLCLTVLLSIPMADEPALSWYSSLDFFKVVVIFIIMINVIRTEHRWRLLLVLLLAISLIQSGSALRNYYTGFQLVEGNRASGSIGNMFENPNDLALHLVTMIPISIGLLLSTRNPLTKLFYIVCAIIMVSGIVVTFSRGGLLGLICATCVLTWKLMRRNRGLVLAVTIILGIAFIAFAPGGVVSRFSSVFDQDQASSVGARKDDLKRSLLVTLRHPFLGVGIGNFALRSNRALATHNAYTQVSAEIGLAGMVLYIMFIVTPLRRLRAMERETILDRKSHFHYLAIGMQASLVGYMVSSFFASVAFLWYVYYLVALSVCLRRFYEIERETAGKRVTLPDRELISPAKEANVAWS